MENDRNFSDVASQLICVVQALYHYQEESLTPSYLSHPMQGTVGP